MIGNHQSLILQSQTMVKIHLFGFILFDGTTQNIRLTTIQVGKQLNPMMTQKLKQSMIGMAQPGHRKFKWLEPTAD